ncbi:hypothetical protein FQN49_006590 [Arthroderma sp. PD_2]|nr:hypothetical protein FQN49_006590 [Arthroderma sp. PD_2]
MPTKLDTPLEGESHGTVGWDGPEDPENPLNWPASKGFGHVVIVAGLSLVVNITSTIVAPGIKDVAHDLKITSTTIATLAVSIYLLGFALGPLVISSLSEIYGRLIVYHVCNIVFVAFAVGCALSNSVSQFLVFRFISGCAGASPLTIGGGTIADVIPVERRGLAAALFGIGPLLGPGGAASIGMLIFMRETHPNILLEHKVKRLRRQTNNPNLKSVLDRQCTSRQQILMAALIRPTKLLLFSPIVLAMSVYVALIFGIMYLLFATFSLVYKGQFGFNTSISGLTYLGLGTGEIIGLFLFGILSDRILKAMAADNVTEPKPEYRLVLMMWFPPVLPIGLFLYGWTVYYKVHWMAPVLSTTLVGFGIFFVIMPSQLYMVDVFGSEAAASALGANILLRSLFGAFLPLAGSSMCASLNYGWGNTLLGFLALAFVPVPFLLYKYGEWLRTRTKLHFLNRPPC